MDNSIVYRDVLIWTNTHHQFYGSRALNASIFFLWFRGKQWIRLFVLLWRDWDLIGLTLIKDLNDIVIVAPVANSDTVFLFLYISFRQCYDYSVFNQVKKFFVQNPMCPLLVYSIITSTHDVTIILRITL